MKNFVAGCLYKTKLHEAFVGLEPGSVILCLTTPEVIGNQARFKTFFLTKNKISKFEYSSPEMWHSYFHSFDLVE